MLGSRNKQKTKEEMSMFMSWNALLPQRWLHIAREDFFYKKIEYECMTHLKA